MSVNEDESVEIVINKMLLEDKPVKIFIYFFNL